MCRIYEVLLANLSMQLIHIVEQNVTMEEDNFATMLNGTEMFISTNETHDPSTIVEVQRNFSGLYKLEASLVQARAAIKEARNGNQMNDPEYVPYGPIYWNASVFHKYVFISTFIYFFY